MECEAVKVYGDGRWSGDHADPISLRIVLPLF
jgi:hypothetical protein